MIIHKQVIQSDQLPFSEAYFPDNTIFFDIETTGLSHRASHLYMIGAICREDGQLLLIQWFLQKPAEEKEVLQQFSQLLNLCKTVIHYNGQTFDVPYIQDRCRYWDLEDPFSNPDTICSLDLYREMRPLKQLFQMSSMKQKDMEKFLHYPRKDQMDGKELIRIYHQYLQAAGEKELQLLLLHNHDDLLGMLWIYRFYSYLSSLTGTVTLLDNQLDGDMLQLKLQAKNCCPVRIHLQAEETDLLISKDQLTLSVYGSRGCFKHYFSNYKDYFYLPSEDTAIHKSVGIYLDSSCRQKAKADTCYVKKEGLFFFQPSQIFLPDFRQDSRKGPSYFSYEQAVKDPSLLSCYAAKMLAYLLKQ